MAGYRNLLSAISSRCVNDNKVNNTNKIHNSNNRAIDANTKGIIAGHSNVMQDSTFSINPQMAHKRKRSARLVTGLQKVFSKSHHGNSTLATSTPIADAVASSLSSTTRGPILKKPYRFESTTHEVSTIDMSNNITNTKAQNTPYSTPPSTADATRVEYRATGVPSMLPLSTLPSSHMTPPTSVHPESSKSANEPGEVGGVHSPSKNAAEVAHATMNTRQEFANPVAVTRCVDPHAVASETVDNNLGVQNDELGAAMAAMRAAEKLLSQRHAAIKPQAANTSKRMKPLGIISKKAGQRASSAPAQGCSNMPMPVQRRTQSSTANKAIEALNRRQAVKDLAFFAADGCPTNVAIIDQMTAHLQLQDRHAAGEIPDFTFKVNGVNICTSQILKGSIERNWLVRYNITISNVKLVERRLLNAEDHELILAQLFPQERAHILKPEHFEIYMDGLGEEGIFTKAQAKGIADVGVTMEEFDKGAYYTLSSGSKYKDRSANAVSIFDIPRPTIRTISSNSTRPAKPQVQKDLYPYLRILVEAAVYNQNFWKGYYFPNARSKLNDFYQAYKLTQEGWLLPPNLTDYKRSWSYRETRLLQRGQYICNLLSQYEANQLIDFGIVRAIRATYVGIPAQPSWCAEDLESFLYHRVTDSGLVVSKIPEILLLHPENDAVVANPPLRQRVGEALEARMRLFEAEEAARLNEIHQSQSTFKEVKKMRMTRWGRAVAGWKKVFGKKVVVPPFNPYDPLHELQGLKGVGAVMG